MKYIYIKEDGTEIEKKRCSKCRKILDPSEFYSTSSFCKLCQKLENRKRVRLR